MKKLFWPQIYNKNAKKYKALLLFFYFNAMFLNIGSDAVKYCSFLYLMCSV